MALYIIDGMQSLLLFIFLFKFKQVEIEILMQLEDPKTILKMLRKLKYRVRTTVLSIFALILLFSVSYTACEMLWFIDIKWFTSFYALGKTIQIFTQTPFYVYFIYLTIRFHKLGNRFQMVLLDKENKSITKIIMWLLMMTFIVYYLSEIFLYMYPYIVVYVMPDQECNFDSYIYV